MSLRHTARITARALAVAALSSALALGLAAPAAAVEATGPLGNSSCVPVTDQDWNALFLEFQETKLLNHINSYRVINGRREVRANDVYNWPAAWASNDSALRGFSPADHIDSLGRNIPRRMNECTAFRNERVGEINYYGQGGTQYTSALAAITWWKKSPPHNALLLDPRFSQVGLALSTRGGRAHWTVVFR